MEFYTVEQLARIFQLHPKTIQRYVREGKLAAQKVGKSWRISGHEASKFLESKPESTKPQGMVSAVADITPIDPQKAERLIVSLQAALNGKPAELGACTLQTQHLLPADTLRVLLYGAPRPVAILLQAVAEALGQEESL